MGLLDGKTALITGGARGQGRAHAVTSAREGADVILLDITSQALGSVDYPLATADDMAETVRQVEALDRRALTFDADVRDQDQLDAAVTAGIAEFGKIDILIANAGIWTRAPFWEMSEQMWSDMMDVNLTGVWKSAKAVAPHMIERQSGSIVITSSVNGLEPGMNYAHYVSTKHGVIGLMKNIALELAPYGIRCNSINPGAILTPMTNQQGAWDMFAGHEGGTPDDLIAGGYSFHALKGTSFMPPEVIANTALYLNSDLAATVTGVTIPVDAGHMLLTGVNPDPVK
ncbi:putative oxidoreductase, short-chain dehydrogenase/reductase family [Gordonia polyisoprenivorans VH2]|uniref:Mycofactocin-coupled SDR family oxidoreductase n=2 Tax=Gordonia polyisoprenivorans TaxID=84595 RepID=A0A846WKH7_9ACTN|nr:mycofactocin-coupled SDR family oxidoreductase [Gordonia polyisoprenivorans]AFA75147.1 putative oxidoreductase, short-chain dehydrogenase/reductase family [Gordonia polyisoprenivorans VH2]MBE7191132.1 mycofactocin-coupled SDR family oxidoreductase [Gordonia polyisoprenivorans]NKY01526.1 mycofactocin-coupled SDR family oxidoreductase [Gordonia polyisoprenivorans]OZC32092.1 SDR family mycofactocin-dependent oxidoreductase [Gordonia polyisoprenivorans]QUD83576.1 mycofactocin-coupled SDR family